MAAIIVAGTISNPSQPTISVKNLSRTAMPDSTASTFYKRWVGRTFRFRLRSFRINRSLYARRFSITEAATLLLLAYFASKLLGLIRQVLFNSLFGAGPAATAYYVAFNIP